MIQINSESSQVDVVPPPDVATENPPTNLAVPQNVAPELLWRLRGVLLLLADAIFLMTMFCMVYTVHRHFHLPGWRETMSMASDDYLRGALLITGIWVLLIGRDGGYESGLRGVTALVLRVKSLLTNGLYSLILVIVIAYLYQGISVALTAYTSAAFFGFLGMIMFRLWFRAADRHRAAAGRGNQHILVVGMDNQAAEFARRLRETGGGNRIAAFLRWSSREKPQRNSFVGRPIQGEYDQIERIYDDIRFNTLVLTSSYTGFLREEQIDTEIIRILNFCESRGIALYMLPPSLDVAIAKHEVGSLSGVPVVRLQDASLHYGYAVAKRGLDVAVATAGLVLGIPLWLVISALIKFTSPGPVFFVQRRIGLHGQPFRIFKFRTMQVDAEARFAEVCDLTNLRVPGFKMKGDPRVTPLGRFLRRTGLDEIPQLFNVLKGEMSLVGPRPELPEFVEQYTPIQRRRLKAKPGITGYQQVMARGQPLAACIKFDLTYLKYKSFLLDMYILARTAVVIIRGIGVSH